MDEIRIPTFRLLASKQVQQHIGEDRTTFNPDDWATYSKDGKTVKAVRISATFMVGGSVCRDGWLVLDDRGLVAVSNNTFSKDYDHTLETAA